MEFQNGKIYTIRSYKTDKYYIGSTNQATLAQRLGKHRSNYKDFLKSKGHYMTSYEILQHEDYYIELLELYPCNSKDELHKREGELQREFKHNIVNKCIAGRTSIEYRAENIERTNENYKLYRELNKEKIALRKKNYKIINKDKIKLYNDSRKDAVKLYNETNKEKMAECKKLYNETNKEKIAECKKLYYESHKEDIAIQTKEYREVNKSALQEQKKEYYNNNAQALIEKSKQYYRSHTEEKQQYDKLNRQIKYTCECGLYLTKVNKSSHEKTQKHKSFITNQYYINELNI